MKPPSVQGVVPLSVLLLALTFAGTLEAQSEDGFGRRPSLWTIQLDAGARLPGTIYNEFLERSHASDPAGVSVQTRWTEENRLGFEGRATVRYRPEAGAGLYMAGVWGRSETEATFSGGLAKPEMIARSASYKGLDFGVTLKLKDWNNGRGLLEYSVGVVILEQSIDLSRGHRAALVYFPEIDPELPQPPLDWSSRDFTNWGLSMGTSFRVPIAEGLHFRATFRDVVIPVNTAELATDEERDIFAISGERAEVTFNGFTAHEMSLSLGLEYTFGWGRARRQVSRRLPGARETTEVSEEVASAIRLAAEGDTAAAISALEHRVSVEPQDPHAWRELGLLKAARAEFDATVRDEVLATLERALNLNPGDTELLRAYGRIRGLVQREGRRPEGAGAEPLALSDVTVEASPGGALRLAWAARNLRETEDGEYRYRIEVEAFREDGSRLELRSGLDRFIRRDDGSLMLEDTAEELPVTFRASAFLVEPEPGIHTVRVWLTDLETGQRIQSSRSFEIPAGG